MKLFNFEIKEDRNGYILIEYDIYKTGENAGKEYITDTTYPSTLQRTFEKIRHRYKKNARKTKTVDEYIEETKKTNEEFLSELSKAIKGLK